MQETGRQPGKAMKKGTIEALTLDQGLTHGAELPAVYYYENQAFLTWEQIPAALQ